MALNPEFVGKAFPYDEAFCVGVESKRGTSTGISAPDRARTVLTAINARTKPADLVRPGHIFPLRARDGGVLVRAGQTEAAVDLARIAGLYPAGCSSHHALISPVSGLAPTCCDVQKGPRFATAADRRRWRGFAGRLVLLRPSGRR